MEIAKRQEIEIKLLARYHEYEDCEEFLSLVLDDGIDFYLHIFKRDHPEEYKRLMKEWPPSHPERKEEEEKWEG